MRTIQPDKPMTRRCTKLLEQIKFAAARPFIALWVVAAICAMPGVAAAQDGPPAHRMLLAACDASVVEEYFAENEDKILENAGRLLEKYFDDFAECNISFKFLSKKHQYKDVAYQVLATTNMRNVVEDGRRIYYLDGCITFIRDRSDEEHVCIVEGTFKRALFLID